MTALWEPAATGVLSLPSGRLVRGRALRRPLPPGPPPTFGVYLAASHPPPVPWPHQWVPWSDFWVPVDRAATNETLRDAWSRAGVERVEIACSGGHGRTGTALACLAVLDGLPPRAAITHVRAHYSRRAVETPWQRRFVHTFC